MPSVTEPIVDRRPIITAAFHVSRPRWVALDHARQTIPNPILGRALIDTGATDSCVDPAVTVALGLDPRATSRVHTASTAGEPHRVVVVDMSIILVPSDEGTPLVLPSMLAMQIDLRSQGIHALIGQDVLARCRLVHDGPRQHFTLSW